MAKMRFLLITALVLILIFVVSGVKSADVETGSSTASDTGTEKSTASDTGTESSSASDTGTEKSIASDTGTESSSASDTGTERSPASDTGTESSPASHTGTEESIASDTGTESSPASDIGSEKSTASDTGTESNPASDTGSEKSTASDSGSGKSIASNSGSERSTASDSGSEKSTASDRGSEKSIASDSGSEKSTASDIDSEKSIASDSGSERSTASDSGSERSTASDSGSEKRTASDSVTERTASGIGSEKSTASDSGTEKSTASESGSEKSTASDSGSEKSTASESGSEKSTASDSGTGGSKAKAEGIKAAKGVEECKVVSFKSKKQTGSESSGKRKQKKYFYKPKFAKAITNVKLIKTLNRNECKKGTSFDFTKNYVWVSNGCSFKAEYCIIRGDAEEDKEDLCGGKICHMNARCRKNKCQCEEGMAGDGVENCYPACVCKSWGDPHTTTNDGSTFHFQGACKYLLSRMADIPGKPECAIDVEAKHEHRNNVNRVSFIRSLDIKLQGMTVTLAPGNVLLIDDEEVSPPYEDDNIEVTYYNRQLILRVLGCDYMVTYDGRSRASVVAPKEYGENLSGMCGNCNEIKSDDFVIPNGTDFSVFRDRDAQWGNFWSVPDDSGFALATCAQSDVRMLCSQEHGRQARELCSRINNPAGPFSQALQEDWIQDIADGSFEGCEFDVCHELERGGDAMATACEMTEAFNKFLEESEVGAVNWRSDDFCPQKCGPNEEYKTEMDCPRTCAHAPDEEVMCTPAPESGCACKPGFILSGTECVAPEQCGCTVGKGKKARYYKIGDSYMSSDCTTQHVCSLEDGVSLFKEVNVGPCHSKARCKTDRKKKQRDCQCNKGLVGDGRTTCERDCTPGVKCHKDARCVRKKGKTFCQCNAPLQGNGVDECIEKCVCTASGDPHYITYDGDKIHYQGVCTYKLTEAGNATCRMKVLAKNQQVEGKDVSTTKKLIVTMLPSTDEIVLDQGKAVYINGVLHAATHISEPDYTVDIVGDNVVVKSTHCDLTAMFDGKHRAKVMVDKAFGPSAVGICGTCDGIHNDFRTADGNDVSGETNRFALIGNSYWEPMPFEEEPECMSAEEVAECPADVTAEIAGNQYCGQIGNDTGPFMECRDVLSSIPGKEGRAAILMEDCQYDICETWDDPAEVERQKCDSLAAFMAECYSLGVGLLEWRTVDFCPMQCGANMEYSPAISMTRPSCDDLRPEQPAPGPLSEGCVCKPGFLYNPGTDSCVLPEECGCSTSTDYVPVGSKIVNEDCTEEKVCVLEGGAAGFEYRDLQGCGANEVCEPKDGVRQCVCKPGFKMIDGTCQEVCENDMDQCHKEAVCIRRPGKKSKCKCKKGWRGDGVRQCNRECVCVATGDPHYHLLDGKKINFQGHCTYRLIKAGTEECGMIVNVKNQQHLKNEKVSMTKLIEVEMKPSTAKIVVDQGGKVFIDGGRQYGNIENEFYKIEKRGRWTTVTSKCDPQFRAEFNGKKTARVSIPREVGPGATGICGNCDGDKTNDFHLKNGTDVSHLRRRDRDNSIGNSWWLPGGHDTEPECMSVGPEPTCDADTTNILNDEDHCGFIKRPNGPFAECMNVNPELVNGFFEDCIYDACALWGNPDDVEEQMCNTLATLFLACQEELIGPIDYRSQICPPTVECTGENMYYVQAIDVQKPSCQVPNPPPRTSPPVDGCECEEPFIMEEDLHQCVLPEECGCFTDDEPPLYYPIGTQFVNDDCTLESTCSHVGGESAFQDVPLPGCGWHEVCQPDPVDGINTCVCEEGYEDNGNGCELIGNCPVGYFYNELLESCEKCAPGTFTDIMGSSSCTPCSVGEFQAEEGATSCDPCAPGTFSDVMGSASCTACLPGEHQPIQGQTSCLECIAGTFSDSGQATCTGCPDGAISADGAASCTDCQPGTIPNAANTACEDCAAGSFSDMVGSETCTLCQPGQYQDLTGQTSCKPCGPGSVSVEGATVCTPCATGEVANADQSACTHCSAGEVPNADQSSCEPCAPGYVSLGAGQTVCIPCGIGTAPSPSQFDCEPCDPGSFSSMLASPECTLCSPGEEQPLPGQTSCNPCPSGYVAMEEGQANCEPCPPGEEPNADKTECVPCATGMVSGGAEECMLCSAGEEPNLDQSACVPCAEGHVSLPGQESCTPCFAGEEPNTELSACVPCAEGYISAGAQAYCTPCSAGSVPNMDQSDCVPCDPGHVAAVGQVTCSPCPLGEEPNTDHSECVPCAPGHVSAGAQESCTPCLIGEEPNADHSACGPCPTGYISIGAQETCTPCGVGEVPNDDSSACLPCAAGHVSAGAQATCTPCPAGEEPSIDQSECVPCAPGHVSMGAQEICLPCPAGQGPDAEKTFCEPCPAGTVSAGGEDCTPCDSDSIPSADKTTCVPCPPGTNPNEDFSQCVGVCDTSQPCLHGGTCSNADNELGYTCACPLGWDGTNCQTRVPIGIPSPPGEEEPEPLLPSPLLPPEPTLSPLVRGCPPGQQFVISVCRDCPFGTFKPDPGMDPCKPCPAGEYQNLLGQASCVKCPAGQYQNEMGKTTCKQCMSGTFTAVIGSANCQPCPSHTPFSTDDRTSCQGTCDFAEPCQNGGGCINTISGGYICVCINNWSGPNCEIPPPLPLVTTSVPSTQPLSSALPPKPPQGPYKECIEKDDPHGLAYFGTQSTTTSGATCQEWVSMHPHPHGYKDLLKTEKNYCRNRVHGFMGLDLPWCFTTDPDIEWEYCGTIPFCSEMNETMLFAPEDKGCYHRSDNATSYEGPVWYALSGKPCGLWTDNGYEFNDNLCRNPTPAVRSKPWCFTDGPNSCIEYCRVPICDSPAPDPETQPCIVKEEASLCENVLTLEGNCYYKFGFGDECDFTVVMNNRQEFTVFLNGIDPSGGDVHELHWNAVGAPSSFTDQRCGTRYSVDEFNKITIRKPLCALCAKKSLDSFMLDISSGQKTCPAR